MNEKLIERKLKNGVKARGGLALKWASPYDSGMPDRWVLMPGRKLFLAELKTTGEDLSPLQKIRVEQLRKLGFEVDVIDDQPKLDEFLKKIER